MLKKRQVVLLFFLLLGLSFLRVNAQEYLTGKYISIGKLNEQIYLSDPIESKLYLLQDPLQVVRIRNQKVVGHIEMFASSEDSNIILDSARNLHKYNFDYGIVNSTKVKQYASDVQIMITGLVLDSAGNTLVLNAPYELEHTLLVYDANLNLKDVVVLNDINYLTSTDLQIVNSKIYVLRQKGYGQEFELMLESYDSSLRYINGVVLDNVFNRTISFSKMAIVSDKVIIGLGNELYLFNLDGRFIAQRNLDSNYSLMGMEFDENNIYFLEATKVHVISLKDLFGTDVK